MHPNKTRWSLIGVSAILFLTFCANQMVPRVGAQAQACAPGQVTITKKSGNGTICNPDMEVEFFDTNTNTWVPALIAEVNILFEAYDKIPGTEWNAMNCARLGADQTVFNYRISFELPASFLNPSLSIQVHCDNAAEIFLNGTSIGAQPDIEDAANFQDPPESFSTNNAALFVPGANVLSFNVHNIGALITALDFLADICYTPAEGCIDENPPSVTCNVAKYSLWPPNHDLINVGLTAVVTDDCDSCEEEAEEGEDCVNAGLDTNVIVYSDEPDLDILGSGRFSPDAKNTALGTLRLRAERSGNEDGRVYLIVVSATDTSGKTGFCIKTVTVPHSQSNASKNLVAAQATAARNFFLANETPPPGYVQVGIGPIVGPKQ